MTIGYRPSQIARLVKILDLPSNVTSLTITIPAGGLVEMTVTRLVEGDELDALSEWFVVEGIEAIPTAETAYSLMPRQDVEAQP